jgi:FAD/FMN-containing dehydrogenase
LICYPFLFRVPPLPAFAKEHHGKVVINLVLVQTGDLEEATRQVQPLRELGNPILDAVGPQPYIDIQKTFDAGMPEGLRWYSRSGFLDTLTDEALDIIEAETRDLPGAFTIVYLTPGGGAVNRIAPDATPYPHRSADYAYHVFPGWADEADDTANMDWARRFQDRLAPLATGGVYVNMLGEDETDRVRAAYGNNYDRLMEIKAKWDPDNLFRSNHNIPPT